MKRLRFQEHVGNRTCSRWRRDGYFGLGFVRLNVAFRFFRRSGKIWVHGLDLDSTKGGEVSAGVRIRVGVLDFADGSVGLEYQFQLLFFLLELSDLLLQTGFVILQLVSFLGGDYDINLGVCNAVNF